MHCDGSHGAPFTRDVQILNDWLEIERSLEEVQN